MPQSDQLRDKSDTEGDEDGPVTRILDRIRATPGGRLALRIGVGVLGAVVIAAGLLMIPLPGPGWAVVILGLAILALEFDWAKRLLEFTRRHVKTWTHWVTRQSIAVRALLGLATFIFVSLIVWASVKLSFHIDLAVLVWNWVTNR